MTDEIRRWFESEEGEQVMVDAMQRFQDFTFRVEDSHRYHCGGSEYRFLKAHILEILAKRRVPA